MGKYTLRLLSLRCEQSQEADGDEIYLNLNGDTIFSWEKIERKFYHKIKSDKHITAFDFRSCKFTTMQGDVPTAAYTPDDFIFKDMDAPIVFDLWESDRDEMFRGDDDHLGQLAISEESIEAGEQLYIFPLDDVEYEFRYIVTE
ncbi:MAG: hypothetical protein RLP44_31795 [Aggregatilineales bacterium]